MAYMVAVSLYVMCVYGVQGSCLITCNVYIYGVQSSCFVTCNVYIYGVQGSCFITCNVYIYGIQGSCFIIFNVYIRRLLLRWILVGQCVCVCVHVYMCVYCVFSLCVCVCVCVVFVLACLCVYGLCVWGGGGDRAEWQVKRRGSNWTHCLLLLLVFIRSCTINELFLCTFALTLKRH